MLGPPKARRLADPIAVSLEDLVPPDNFYRHLDAKLDLGFVRAWARELYAKRGRPSIDPVVFCTLQLVLCFEGIRAERQLIETASLHLAHRWYLGSALNEELPDHSSLTRIRQRLGLPIFARFFERIVDLCQGAGLVWGRELFFDATKVRANADLDSLVPRFFHQAKAHVAELFAEEPSLVDERSVGTDDPSSRDGLLRFPASTATTERGGEETTELPWRLLEERRLDPRRPAVGHYRRTTDFRVSPTDPDAAPMWTGGGTALGYHDHYVVDGGRARIILAALVTPSDVMENVPMRDLLWRVCFRRGLWPRQVTGDTTYGTTENIVAIEDQGIRAYLPLPDWGSRRPAFFGPDDFAYDAAADTYCCPAGHALRRAKTKRAQEVVVYQGDPATCNACPLKAACTESYRGRTVHRSFYADYLDRVRAYHATAAYQKALRKRQVWVEPR